MERVVVQVPAKINLTLDVTGRRDDGYHLIHSVMQSVELCDTVTVKLTGAAAVWSCPRMTNGCRVMKAILRCARHGLFGCGKGKKRRGDSSA